MECCNIWVLERKKMDLFIACAKTNHLLNKFEAPCGREKEALDAPARYIEDVSWKTPTEELTKINTNVAVTKEGKVGLGMAVCDNMGEILMSAGRNGLDTTNACQAEAMKLLFGLRFRCGF